MKRRAWQAAVGAISCIVLYRLLSGFDFSVLHSLSPAALYAAALISLAFIVAELVYLRTVLKASSLLPTTGTLLFIYCASHMIGTFTTYYIGLTSFIVMVKKIFQTTYEHALSCSLRDLAVRYSLRLALAYGGICYLAGGYYGVALLAGAVAACACAMLLRQRALPVLLRAPGALQLWNTLAGMKQSFMDTNRMAAGLLLFWALAGLVLESFLFFYIIKSLGNECDLLIIICIRCLGLFIGYLSFLPTMNFIEDVSAIGLFVLIGLDVSAVLVATAATRFFITLLPLCVSMIVVNRFFEGYRGLVRESRKTR